MKIKKSFLQAKVSDVQASWRDLKFGNLVVTTEGMILDNSWQDVGEHLEYLINNPSQFEVQLAGEVVPGMCFVGWQIDWQRSRIFESGQIVLLKLKNKKAKIDLVWMSLERILQGVEIDKRVKYLKSLTIAS